MSEQDKAPPNDEDEYSAFKNLLDKIAKVPKAEVDKLDREYREQGDHRRSPHRKTGS